MRDSPLALASLGTGIAPLKFKVFCLSAFVAGLGGAMLSAASQQASSFQYFRLQSLLFLALAVIGGIGTWAGALMGATMFQMLSVLLGRPWVLDSFVSREIFNGQLEQLLPVFFGLGAIGLASNPNGVIEQTRDGWAKFRARLSGAPVAQEQPAVVDAPAVEGDGRAVTFPRASYYHRPGCVLATGKEGKPVTAARARKLASCPLCEPEPVAAARPRAARSRSR
jgi:MFS family permease